MRRVLALMIGCGLGMGCFSSALGVSAWRVLANPLTNNGVAMLSATEGWAVGDQGLIHHTTDGGVTWTVQVSGTSANLNGVWAADASHVWAVGDGGVIVKYDGTAWVVQTSPVTTNLMAVHGLGTSAVWAVGSAATFLKYDGTAWATQAPPSGGKGYTLNGVFALDATHVWAVGTNGRAIFYNGSTWTSQNSGVTTTLWSVWASSTTNILAVGDNGTVRVSGGTTWAAGPASGLTANLRGISGTNGSHVWVASDTGTIAFYDGTSFTAQNSNLKQAFYGVSAAASNLVVAVGARTSFDVYDGAVWNPQVAPVPPVTINSIWGTDDDKVWFAGGGGALVYFDGKTFSTPSPSGVTVALNGVWGADANNVWAVGAGGTILKWNGSTWTAQAAPGGSTQNLNAVWGTSVTDVWAVGDATTGSSPQGTIFHFDGTAWTLKTSNSPNDLTGVYAASAKAVWVVGGKGTLLSYDGSVFNTPIPGLTQNLTKVQGLNSKAVWAVGASGLVLYFNGSAWSSQTSGTTTGLNVLAAADTTNQWAAGSTTIIKGNGTAAWSPDGSTGYPVSLTSAWASGPNTAFLGATNGMIFVNSPAAVPQITVEQPAGTGLVSEVSTVDIGTVGIPASVTKTFTIKSAGTADLTGLTLSLTGANKSEFSFTTLASTVLAAGASTTFDVTFKPTVDGLRSAVLNIASNDLDEPLFSIALTATGIVPVVISTQPFLTKTVNPNTAVTISCAVNAATSKPVHYQWEKYNAATPAWEVLGAPDSASYVIAHALEADEGDYRCMVTNAISSVPTSTATLLVNDPIVITASPLPVTVEHNKNSAVTFSVAVTGTTPKFVWRKNGTAIASAPNAASLTIANPQVADGGDYTVVVSNVVNSLTSGIATLTVVDTNPKVLPAAAGAKTVITASYGGRTIVAGKPPATTFGWLRNTATITDPRYGILNNTITIAETTVGDPAEYTCDITGLDGVTLTTKTTLVVYTDPPEIVGGEPLDMGAATVGDPSYTFQIPVKPGDAFVPTAFTATGLPAGLTCDKTTGLITGRPTVAVPTEVASKAFTVTLTASNAKNKSTKKGTLLVKPLPAASVGVFAGPIDRSALHALGGRFDLTTTTNGAFTGKVTLGILAYPLSGLLIADGVNTPRATVTTKGTTALPSITVSFKFDLVNHVLTDGLISGAAGNAGFSAWRKRWGTVMPLADSNDLKTYLGYYTFGLRMPGPAAEDKPQGAGWGSFTVAANTGAATAAGKLADGTAFTCASFCGPAGQILVYQALYGNLGSVLGTLDIAQGTAGFTPAYGDNTLDGTVSWLRPQILAAANHLYRSGFGPVDCGAAGGRYVPPTATQLLLGISTGVALPNARLTFTEGGIGGTTADPTPAAQDPNMDVSVKLAGKTETAKHSTTVFPDPNPCGTTLSVVAGTGLFTAKATLVDFNPAKPGYNITRPITGLGILFRDTDAKMRGLGYFLLPRRPAPATTQTVTTTDQLSGLVKFEEK